MDVGKLGDTKLEDFTNNAYDALTSVGFYRKILNQNKFILNFVN